MRKQWFGTCVAAGLLAACTSNDGQQQAVTAPQPAVCNGPNVEISGAEPRYEPLNAIANQDYQRDGKSYKIVNDASRFSQTGFAAIYVAEPGSNLTASGEMFDPMQLTAAHPTLPVPSYARITNMANGRIIVVRINDRGPYGNDRVISLSRAAADRLNTSNNTKVRIDPIVVAQDGSLSGPGTACTTIAKQTYALPSRPDLNGGMASVSPAPQAAQPQGDVREISNATLQNDDNAGAPIRSRDFLGAPTPLNSGVLESSEPAATTPPAAHNAPVTAPGSVQDVIAAATHAATTAPITAAPVAAGSLMVQAGAVRDQGRAQQFQQRLSQQFSAPGRVVQNGAVWRIQLGPFSSKAEASALQQRLQNEAKLQSFIASAN